MNKTNKCLALLIIAFGIGTATIAQNNPDELIVCGWDEVFILDMSKQDQGLPAKVWSWTAINRTDLPQGYRHLFNSTDECKPVDNGTKILITSSGGGVALVQRKSGAVLFYARVPNAHSADLLPGNKIAVAASVHPNGNRLVIFDLDMPDKELVSDQLPSGHGVVWDHQRQVLWALADAELKVYKLHNWDSPAPGLSLLGVYQLPETGGHDLYPMAASDDMSVTTSNHCWIFNKEKGSFKLHPKLAEKRSVKCISTNPINEHVVYIKADTSWWSETLRFLNPDLNVFYKNQHFYKARWNVEIN